jgi:hypothetical protein
MAYPDLLVKMGRLMLPGGCEHRCDSRAFHDQADLPAAER